jgi:hypothetical protein
MNVNGLKKEIQMEKNSDSSMITRNRFVAFFDILGFKDRVMRESHDQIYKDLAKIQIDENALREIISNENKKFGIHVVKFSDSIIVFSENDTVENFIVFLIAARVLFCSFLTKKFLIKGGMAYGNISLDKKNQLYFGQPIIDAYLLEEDVNYIGVIIHNSIEEFKHKNIKEDNKYCSILKQLIFEGQSPLKSGNITHFNLNWFSQLIGNKLNEDKDVKTEVITRLKEFYLQVSGSPRRYIDNTIALLINNNEIDFKKLRRIT